MDWDMTMQVIPWVGCQSKMKSPNSKIIEIGRRKGRNKENEGFRVKMDKTTEKVKKLQKKVKKKSNLVTRWFEIL